METRAKGHPRIEPHGHLARRNRLGEPGRDDDDPPDPLRDVARLPGFEPVPVIDRGDLQLANRTQPEGLQVPEGALCGIDGHRRLTVVGNVGRHQVWRVKILAHRQLVVRVANQARGPHRGAASEAAEDLADRLDGLVIAASTVSSSQRTRPSSKRSRSRSTRLGPPLGRTAGPAPSRQLLEQLALALRRLVRHRRR